MCLRQTESLERAVVGGPTLGHQHHHQDVHEDEDDNDADCCWDDDEIVIDKFNIDTILRHLHIVEGQVIFSGGCEGLKSNPPKNYKPFRHTHDRTRSPPSSQTTVKRTSRMPSWWRECPRDVEKPSKVTEMMIVVVDEIDHHLQGGERGGQHEDPNQREGQPVETDQSQVYGLFKLCKCQ